MKKILLLFSLVLSVLSFNAIAQSRTVTGRVTSANDGSPLPGVSVVVKGTTTGTNTDVDGRYELTVNGNQSLVFSYLGFNSREIPVGTRTSIDVQLQESAKAIGEVVVVGYGTQERRELTGATAQVTAAAIEDLPVVGVDQALQGRAAGVQISQNSGTPGGGVSVRIRGASSISASNQPLYVVDGVPLTTGDYTQLSYGGQGVNALSDLNPSDIESIDILKDASAAAIYGSRAANGVVLITTKRGKANKTTINLNTYYGIQNMWNKPSYLNADQYKEVILEAYKNDMYLPQDATFDDWVDWYYGGVDFDYTGINTDWISEVSRKNAPIKSHEISVSGGDLKTRYYISGNYFDQQGIIRGSSYERYSGRLNLDHNFNEKLSFTAGIQLSNAINNRIVSDNTVVGPFANSLAASPIWPVRYEDGSYTQPNYYYTNPVAEGIENDGLSTNLRALGNITATYTIIPKLNLNVRAGVDALNLAERRYTATNYPGSSAESSEGSATRTSTTVIKRLLETTLDYRFNLGTTSNLTVLVGASNETNSRDVTSVTGEGFAGERFRFASSASRISNGTNLLVPASLVSFFGRANLNLSDKYLLGLNFRTDGSSRFGENHKYGFFPSVSAGWRVLEESFMPEIGALSELKLRASYGITGNQEIGDFSYLNFVTASPYADRPGLAFTQLGNNELQWEETKQFNAGLDFGLFNNRVNLSADYYIKTTENLLFARPVPHQNGFRSYFSNIGSVENKGWELALNTVNFTSENKGFNWTTDFNISFNRNKVLELYEGQDIFYGFGGNSLVLREGQPIGTFYGFQSDGIFARTEDVPASRAIDRNNDGFPDVQAGDVNFRDISGDGIITDADLTVIGNAQPDFVGGITNNFSFKGFDLSAFFQFSVGNEIANPAMQYQQHLGSSFLDDNMRSIVLNRWRNEGDVTNVPVATVDDENRNFRSNQDRFIYDGSYVRLKNLMLGYSLPSSVLTPIKVRTVRFYVQAQNLITWTDYPGFDPEVNFAGASNTTLGVDFYTFPQARTFTFGVNIGL